MSRTKQAIVQYARSLGFDAVRVTTVALSPKHQAALEQWLDQGRHASMKWMETRRGWNGTATDVLPSCRSVICLATGYHIPDSTPPDPGCGRVSRYARTRDYHKTIGRQLKALVRFMTAEYGGDHQPCVDTVPVFERAYCQQAGLGAVGRNTCLITPEHGSYLFLSLVLTSLQLPADAPRALADVCTNCHACVKACPTKALRDDRTLDAGRCLSWLTIENPGEIPIEFRENMADRVFGCDTCQEVCPANRTPAQTAIPAFRELRIASTGLPLVDLLSLDQPEFLQRFQGTPLMRAKLFGLLRNACVAAGNRPATALLPALRQLAQHPANPVLREHADWAINRIQQEKQPGNLVDNPNAWWHGTIDERRSVQPKDSGGTARNLRDRRRPGRQRIRDDNRIEH